MATTGYKKISGEEPDNCSVSSSALSSPTIVVSSPTAGDNNTHRQSIQFAKAAFVFRDQLDDIRKKRSSITSITEKETEVSPSPSLTKTSSAKETETETTPLTKGASSSSGSGDADKSKPADPAAAAAPPKDDTDPITARRLGTLHLVQGTLTGLLSVGIGVLQGKVFVDFQRTKDLPGAWPTHPNLLPTILLLAVAAAAAVFDAAMLAARVLPGHRARAAAMRIAASAHTLLSCVKTVAYVLTAVVCRGGFNYGNASGNKNDLWSWTCSAAGDKMGGVTGAGFNCDGQTAAWYISLAQIGIEGVGIFGTFLIKQHGKKNKLDFPDDPAEFEKMAAWGKQIDDTLSQMTGKPAAEKA